MRGVENRGTVRIERCGTIENMAPCVDLQRFVWNYEDSELVPEVICVVAAKTGGHVLVAFDGELPVGFSLAFAACRKGTPFWHSHMLGVRSEYQSRGIGMQLKLRQREDALALGIQVIEWTFDPFALRNAHFNIVKLGVVVRRLYPNLYGITTSPLHGGLPTDRLVAEWRLPLFSSQQHARGHRHSFRSHQIQVVVPRDIQEIRKSDPTRALEIQTELRSKLQQYFNSNHAITGFEMNDKCGVYLLEPYED